jgi:uncharacterized protein (TIGR00251 family)
MSKRELNITDASHGAAITVRVVPRANRTEVVGLEEDGTVKIRLMSPPVEGGDENNEALIDFLADLFDVSPQDIEIVAGLEGRRKLVSVLNIGVEEVERRVRAAAGS